MATIVSKPVICPLIVGRARQLEALRECLEQARRGVGQTVVVAGEAGIGKSRLVSEVRTEAEQQSFTVLQGNCFDSDSALPYAAFVDLLRAFGAAHSSTLIAQVVGDRAGELSKIVPDVVAELPAATPTPPLDAPSERRRLMHALWQCFADQSERQPLLIVLEDLHWADDTSLESILYLARAIPNRPIVLLLTMRSDEAHPELDHILAELDRARLAIELRIPALSESEVAAMLQAIAGVERPVPGAFVEAVHGLTDGNPFFIEELVKSLLDAADGRGLAGLYDRYDRAALDAIPLPRTVNDALRRRAGRLDSGARRVLAVAAVAGQRFRLGLLEDVLGLAEPELLAALKDLLAAQMVVEEAPDWYAFRHALTRQAVYAELLGRERQSLHRMVGEALERQSLAAPLDDLARHFYAAGIWEKAAQYGRRAGEQSLELHSPRAAIELLTLAIRAAELSGQPVSPALHRARGLAQETQGDFEAGRADFEVALALACSTHDRHAEWESLLDLGMLWAARDYGRTGEYYARALELARELGERPMLAHSLNRIGNWRVNVDQPGDAVRFHQEALTIFQDFNDRRGLAETLDFLGMASYLEGDLVECAAYYERAVTLFRELGDRPGLCSSLATLALCGGSYENDTCIPAVAHLTDLTPHGEESVRIAREIGWRAGEAYAATQLALCLGAQGAYARALEVAQDGQALADEIEHVQWQIAAHCTLGALYHDLLLLPRAREHLERALGLANETGSFVWINWAVGHLAVACVSQGDLGRAEEILGRPALERTIGQRLHWLARAMLELARARPAETLRSVDLLAESPGGRAEARLVPRLGKLRGEALAALRRPGEAEAALLAARDAALSQGATPLLWRIRVSLGDLYRARGRGEDAEMEYLGARETIEALAGELEDESLRQGFLRGAGASIPRKYRPSTSRVTRPAPGGLTPRESEVAVLVARGLSNRAIAESLVISERTVEDHVSNALAKLGFTSRAQVAAWAAEGGLA